MRTKTIETFIDRIFWALILIMPILAYLIINFNDSTTFLNVLSQFNVNETNLIYSGLVDIFGTGGIIEFLDTSNTNVILLYMSYFVVIELVHIFVDVILFVPKICITLLDRSSNLGKVK